MSSHREAPSISQDPAADNADVYAFVSPDDPSTVTILSNFVPLQGPPGGPNFFEFGDDVLYSIFIDNDGDALPNITYQFQFNTTFRNEDTFLYNTGQIKSIDSPNWNKRQFYDVSVILDKRHGPGPDGKRQHHEQDGKGKIIGANLACPPCNIGPRSIPDYEPLAVAAVHSLPSGETVFAGQRNDGFFVDLGAIFDLGDIRELQGFHLIKSAAGTSVDPLKTLNIHTIAIKVPISMLTRDGSTPTDPTNAVATLGIWSAASRRKVTVRDEHGNGTKGSGPWVQVSRLGNPLFNEVIVHVGDKDRWNAVDPIDDAGEFESYVNQPELARLLPILYPGVFPNLAAYTKDRADLHAILLTGIPNGVVPGFPGNFTGPNPADMLRLNVAIPPASKPNAFGLLGGDIAGFPNGRRVFDDIVTIELQAIAGATLPFVDAYTPDTNVGAVQSYLTPGTGRYQDSFPYLGTPHDGYDTPDK
jgi:hypothetical protein